MRTNIGNVIIGDYFSADEPVWLINRIFDIIFIKPASYNPSNIKKLSRCVQMNFQTSGKFGEILIYRRSDRSNELNSFVIS